jgi:catechol 2,3-dioxygenase-like lactoylglutathione lyase family enzyme
MGEQPPKLVQLNLLVEDMAASLDFYRRLGVATADEESGPHAELSLPGGFTLELDTTESARLWHAGVRAGQASARGAGVVIGFSLPSRAAVDTAYAEMTAAGYPGRQPPFDAFWGGRYAIVADPSGNDVGLMSPVDESMRSWPPEESPA